MAIESHPGETSAELASGAGQCDLRGHHRARAQVADHARADAHALSADSGT
jgi:hypothetical protein